LYYRGLICTQTQQTLDEFSRVTVEFPKTAIVIMGYTDSTSAEDYNQKRSERRANAVMNYLIRNEVHPDRTRHRLAKSNRVT